LPNHEQPEGQAPLKPGALPNQLPEQAPGDPFAIAESISLLKLGRSAAPAPDLTACDLEPITRLERIQSFGFMLAVAQDWSVTRVSANLHKMLGIAPQTALGAPLDALIDRETLHDVRNRMSGLAASRGTERIYGVTLIEGRGLFDLAVHYAGDACVFEGEPAGIVDRVDTASLVRKMVARLSTRPTLEELHRDAARQVRAITGYDRVMVYRFSPDGAGEVIAEASRAGMQPLLGLHYPASDIPVQARALYLRNPFRIIADVRSETVPLLSINLPNSAPLESLDLSQAITRSVSPVHLEYLRNMAVGASVSISIIVEGRLWGLIACHHDTARLPTFVIRTATELFGQMYSMTLESRIRQVADTEDRRGRESVSRMMKAISADKTRLTDAGWLKDTMRGMIDCDGIAIWINGALAASGITPPAAAVAALATRLNDLSPSDLFVSDTLAFLEPELGAPSSDSAGVLCIPISRTPGDYILLFRRERLHEIRWAGEPGKMIGVAAASERVSPRKSFAAFSESVRGRSRPFTESEQRVAETIRSGLMEAILRSAHDHEVEQTRLSGRQELLIAELNHRVRNLLALIRGLISQTQGEDGESAKYVDSLNGRVQALARAHDRVTRQNWGPGPLYAIFDDEIAAYVPTQRSRFAIHGPAVLLQPQAYSTLALVVHELVTNSSKYGALCDNGAVHVTLSLVAGEGLHMQWVEVGGPPVVEPTRRGFGSVIIERVVPFDLQGTAVVAYLPAGLKASFLIPERYIAAVEQISGGIEAPQAAVIQGVAADTVKARPLEGLHVLLVEDNLIVAIEAEDLLRTLGAASVVMVSSSAAANKVHETTRIDFAVLDINLGFESSFGFAAVLRCAGIPFIFASGYGEHRRAEDLQVIELTVSKPYDRDYLSVAIANTLALRC
jgi:light-regulated signal transduction histidine kinase (bacteriophytochrome)/CheY-like chemotaxis protein